MDIDEATTGYEHWLRGVTDVVEPELAHKYAIMADPDDPFCFFRATYYWWAAVWGRVCPELADAPPILAVGDLHVENFGTWRDSDGRLVWGVNDFDEVEELPYTNDLVRLAVSLKLARATGKLRFRFGKACAAVLRGYRDTLAGARQAFVLEELHPHLRAMAMSADRAPPKFWRKMNRLLDDESQKEYPPPTPDAIEAMNHDLPCGHKDRQVRFRPRAGAGSLGKRRHVTFVTWAGAYVAREAKALTPPSPNWMRPTPDAIPCRITPMLRHAVRCPDPYYRLDRGWIVRRLAPRCSRIELKTLKSVREIYRLFRAMGAETANLHAGWPGAVAAVLKDLDRRPDDWLEASSRRLCKTVRGAWRRWRDAYDGETAACGPGEPTRQRLSG